MGNNPIIFYLEAIDYISKIHKRTNVHLELVLNSSVASMLFIDCLIAALINLTIIKLTLIGCIHEDDVTHRKQEVYDALDNLKSIRLFERIQHNLMCERTALLHDGSQVSLSYRFFNIKNTFTEIEDGSKK